MASRKRGRLIGEAPPTPAPGLQSPDPEPAWPFLTYRRICTAILAVSAVLIFSNLAQTHFWGDEADVAILARNFLEQGMLTGWDGRNLYDYRNASLLQEDLTINNPPLQYYVAALSFKVFGISTGAGRFPFALLGLFSLWALYLSLKKDFPDYGVFHAYALTLFGLSMPFILNVRQCRYYSLSLLLTLIAYYFYRLFLDRKSWRSMLGFAAALVAGFYTNYLLLLPFMVSILAIFLLFDRRKIGKSDLSKIAVAVFLFAAATLPFAILNKIWHRPDMVETETWFHDKAILIWRNFRDLNGIGVTPWILVVITAIAAALNWKKATLFRMALQWLLVGCIYTLVLALLSPQPVLKELQGAEADVRYTIPAYPFLMAVLALPFWFIHRRFRHGKWAAIVLLLVALSTNVFSLGPKRMHPSLLLPAYIDEISHEYPTPISAAVEYLNKNAAKDDLVHVFPEWYAYPIMWYLGDRILLAGTLDRYTHLGRDRVRKLNKYLLMEENFPQWVISFGGQDVTLARLKGFSRPHKDTSGKIVQYQYGMAAVLPVYYMDTNRPELFLHTFGPRKNFNKNTESVYVFKRVREIRK